MKLRLLTMNQMLNSLIFAGSKTLKTIKLITFCQMMILLLLIIFRIILVILD